MHPLTFYTPTRFTFLPSQRQQGFLMSLSNALGWECWLHFLQQSTHPPAFSSPTHFTFSTPTHFTFLPSLRQRVLPSQRKWGFLMSISKALGWMLADFTFCSCQRLLLPSVRQRPARDDPQRCHGGRRGRRAGAHHQPGAARGCGRRPTHQGRLLLGRQHPADWALQSRHWGDHRSSPWWYVCIFLVIFIFFVHVIFILAGGASLPSRSHHFQTRIFASAREGAFHLRSSTVTLSLKCFRHFVFDICLSVCRFVKLGNVCRKCARCFVESMLKSVHF